MLSAWADSTPVQPWTNNPLGMPVTYGIMPHPAGERYARFAQVESFRDAFKRFTKSSKGHAIADILMGGSGYSDAWREIHGLKWPSNATESEYPVKLMDVVTSAYASKVTKRNRPAPTTSGITHAPPDVHGAMRKQSLLLNQAANLFSGASDGIAHIMKGMNNSG